MTPTLMTRTSLASVGAAAGSGKALTTAEFVEGFRLTSAGSSRQPIPGGPPRAVPAGRAGLAGTIIITDYSLLLRCDFGAERGEGEGGEGRRGDQVVSSSVSGMIHIIYY